MLPSLQSQSLKDQVTALVRERWIRPELADRTFRVDPAQADALARQTLDAMLTRPWRISKLPEAEEYDSLLAKVRHWVGKSKPVRIKIGYAPMKNLRTCRHSRADWSEFFALTHLCAWQNKVRSVYPPGLRIKIIFDDSTVAMANRHDRREMDSYIHSIARLIDALDYRSFLVGIMRQSSFAWLFHFGLYQWAERRVSRWEREPENQAVVDQMTQFARRNLLLPATLSEQQQEEAYRQASHRYRVYWEALQLSGLSKLGHDLIGMYLDGNQHHIRQAAALHLATLGKEQVTQPWQGEGAVRDNGKGKLVPLVLTAGRRAKMTVEEVGGLNLLPLEGFDTIQVCWDLPEGSSSGGESA